MRGLLEVMGMIDDTVLRKMVSDNKIVTPDKYITLQVTTSLHIQQEFGYKMILFYTKSICAIQSLHL